MEKQIIVDDMVAERGVKNLVVKQAHMVIRIIVACTAAEIGAMNQVVNPAPEITR